ncbi:MAG TPA: DNA polymerase III subunit delta, partial [Isosphaeraceae bacterium]|nr:DNA polymerase III subunit delta [Isosphaeraceae bacterium]
MNALEWLRGPKQQLVRPVVVVCGDDSYLTRESIHTVVRAIFPDPESDASVTRFSGAAVSLADVLDEVGTIPFFSHNRLVVVDEADPFVTKYRKDLEAYAANPFKSGCLLLQCKSWPGTTNLAKLIAATGLVIDCGSPREAELAPWLVELAKTRFETRLDADAVRQLIELAGPETGILAAEVEKLAVYAGSSGRIERDDVIKLVGAGRVETIWKALDAATTGQSRAALVHLDNLLAAGEQPIPVLAAMSTNLMKLHHAGILRSARLDLDEACKRAGIPSFAIEKTKKQHAHLGPRRVNELPATLLRADLDIKGGSTLEPRVVLEMLLVHLAV